MKKMLMILGLAGVAMVSAEPERVYFKIGENLSGGYVTVDEHRCGPSREGITEQTGMVAGDFFRVDNGYIGHELTFAGTTHRVKIRVGDLFKNYFRKTLVYRSEHRSSWYFELATTMTNEEHDFYYETIYRNPDVENFTAFKEVIKEIILCRYGSFTMIEEGDDYIEYEADGKRFYHGFMLGESLFGIGSFEGQVCSLELIGYSSIENYDEHRALYVEGFQDTREQFAKAMRERGLELMNH